MTVTDVSADLAVRLVIGVARLGEMDLRGWWRSHGLDSTGRYVLPGLFRTTWRPTALDLDIASAQRHHQDLVARRSALHLFSDELPFRRWASAWLAEQKGSREDPVLRTLEQWSLESGIALLREWTTGADISGAEDVGNGRLLGTISQAELREPALHLPLAKRLAAGYIPQDGSLRPPYFDLAT